ncbi:MAG TPA: NUDIX domain-containing protein [Anaerolineales bacterium]|nr:NUDIX domain-containing protein [Anaerolineales bacterium]HLO31829.1 NUDIX domain-containing protein [Anaerolineales bacterium]
MSPNHPHQTKRILLKVWRVLPAWLQAILSRIIRPLFQVFAAAVIFDQHKNIFLVKSTYQRFHPWGLPGGSLEYGEHPEQAVLREVWEETRLNICIERLLLVSSWLPDRVGLYYLCRITDGTFLPTEEVSEFAYYSIDSLPDISPLDIDVIRKLHQMVEHELA